MWVPFLLGRPGSEYTFEFPPDSMVIQEYSIAALHQNLAGDVKKSVFKSNVPSIKVNSNFLQKTQRDQFASLARIDDTFLSFQTRDDWQTILERNISTSTTKVIIQNTSATKLSAALVALTLSSMITINGVFTAADGAGTNYFTGGSYADATRTITLGSALSGANTVVYVTYTYKGWFVDMKSLPHSNQSGWTDKFSYDFELVGV